MELTINVHDYYTAKFKTMLLCSDWSISEDCVSVATSTFKFTWNGLSGSQYTKVKVGDLFFINTGLKGTIMEKTNFCQKVSTITEDKDGITIITKSLFSLLQFNVYSYTDGEEQSGGEYPLVRFFNVCVFDGDFDLPYKDLPWGADFHTTMAYDTNRTSAEDRDSLGNSDDYPYEKGKTYSYIDALKKIIDWFEDNQFVVLEDGEGVYKEFSVHYVFKTSKALMDRIMVTARPLLGLFTAYPTINLEDDFINNVSVVFKEMTATTYVVCVSEENVVSVYNNGNINTPINITTMTYDSEQLTSQSVVKESAMALMGDDVTDETITFNVTRGVLNLSDFEFFKRFKLLWHGKEIDSHFTGFTYNNDFANVSVTFGYRRYGLKAELDRQINRLNKVGGKA